MKKIFQVCVCVFFSLILFLTCLTDPFQSLADGQSEYYNFQQITSLSELSVGELVYFSSSTNNMPTGPVTSLPDNTGVLEVTSTKQDAGTPPPTEYPQFIPKYPSTNSTYYDYIMVNVRTSDDQFDECMSGYLFFVDGRLYYSCLKGGIGYSTNALAGNAVYKCLERPAGSGDPIPNPVPKPVPGAKPDPQPIYYEEPAPEPEIPVYVHEHNYFWQEGVQATEDNNGEMVYVCPECGEVIFRVPTSAYAVFNSNAEQKIYMAPANSTVKIETERWISFYKSVLIALAYRPDVSLEVNFLSEGHKGDRMSFTIPAGSDIAAILNNEDYCGFLYLYSILSSGTGATETAQAETATVAPVETTNNTDLANTQDETQAQPKPQPKPEAQAADNALAGGQITIPSGVDSYYVAQQLEQAGIIDSAAAYDRYLVQNGYDRRIQIGTKTIPEGSDNQQIAQIITSR